MERNIRPIRTRYNNILFRSRLEAKWALYLDLLGHQWEYEPEGYTDGNINYLPDFYLKKYDTFIEIKPEIDTPEKELNKIKMLSNLKDIIVFKGEPKVQSGKFYRKGEESIDGILTSVYNKFCPFYFTDVADIEYFDIEYEISLTANSHDFKKGTILQTSF